MSKIEIVERNGRFLVMLRKGKNVTRLGGFASKRKAEEYVERLDDKEAIEAATERATEVVIHEVGLAADAARDWTAERNELIVAAVAAGAPLREVARVTGLSHTAVRQIVRRDVA